MQSAGVLQQILDAIALAIQPGARAIHAHVLFYFQIFLFFELLRFGYAYLWSGHVLESVANTLIRSALVYWLLSNWPDLMMMTQEAMIALGLLAGGNATMTVATFLDPGSYIRMGIDVGQLLYETMTFNLGLTSIAQGVGYLILWIVYTAAFLVMAGNIMIWQLEFLVGGLMTIPLLPCLVWKSTSWIAGGTLSYMVNASFRFGCGALVASLVFPLLRTLTLTKPVSFQSVIVTCGAAWTFAIIFWHVNKFASAIISGFPSLGFSAVAQAAATTAALGAGVATGVGSLGAGALAAGATAGRAGLGAAGALRAGGSVLGSGGGSSLAARLGPALTAARMGAGTALQSPLAARLGNVAGASGRTALSQGNRSLSQFADVSRYAGHDQGHGGTRR